MSCKYCKRYENIRGYDGEAFIDDYEFYIDIDDFDNESVLEVHSLTSNEIARIRIQYCPMCGRKL